MDVLLELVEFARIVENLTQLQLLVKFVSLVLLAADELVTGK